MPELCATTPPNTPPGANSCTRLQACCAMLDDQNEQAACGKVASGGAAAACSASVEDFCASTPPTNPGGADACRALSTCCEQLDNDDVQDACVELASDADDADCSEALTKLCPDREPTDPDEENESCQSFALDGNSLLVGSPQKSNLAQGNGKAVYYTPKGDDWEERQVLTSPEPAGSICLVLKMMSGCVRRNENSAATGVNGEPAGSNPGSANLALRPHLCTLIQDEH